jgi:tetratricopeptide (TPR) repeat protein
MRHEEAAGQQLMLEVRARDAWNQRDYVGAQHLAEELARTALDGADDLGWWNATFLVSESLRKQGRMEESKATAESLAEHPLTLQSKALSARVWTLLSFAVQGSGDLALAVAAARKAVEDASGDPLYAGVQVEAQNALIAALADSDQLEAAWKECLVLDDLLRSQVVARYAGQSYWAIGNVAFLLGRISEGVSYHQLAAKNLSPTNDLDLWARFNRASASLRLTAGVLEPETLECIERAELASSIVGGTERDRLELRLTRAQWLVLTGQFDAAIEQLGDVIDHKDLLATHTAAEAHFFLGRALSGQSRDSEALDNLEASEDLFLQSGAQERAAAARSLMEGIGT